MAVADVDVEEDDDGNEGDIAKDEEDEEDRCLLVTAGKREGRDV